MSCLINMYQEFIFKFKVTVRLTKNVSIQDQYSQFSKSLLVNDTALIFFVFHRSNDSSTVTRETIIVAILLTFVAFVLVSVFVIRRNRREYGCQKHMLGTCMYRWKSLFFKIGIRKCLLLKCILVFPFNIPWNNFYLNILNSTNNVTISTCL